MSHSAGHESRTEIVAGLLARGSSIRGAAKAVGMNEKTVFRWLKRDDFRKCVSDLRSRLVDKAVGGLCDASGLAVVTLRKLLASKREPIRLSASRALLEYVLSMRSEVEFSERLEAVEEKLQELSK